MGRAIVLCLVVLAACGVRGSKPLGDVTGDDIAKLCGEEDPESFTCSYEGGEYTVTFGTDCEQRGSEFEPYTSDCSATVADYRICRQAYRSLLAADPCASEPEVECAFSLDCKLDDTDT